jgi:hypothetical protein
MCGAGNVAFRRCSDGTTIVLMCDECGSVWLDPKTVTAESVLNPKAPGFQVPGLSCAVGGGHAGWATASEILRVGWSEIISGEGTALDERRSSSKLITS